MSTTGPVNSGRSVTDVGSKAVQRVGTNRSSSSSTVKAAETSPTQVADSVQETRKLIDVAQNEIRRTDEALIEELKNAIKEGRFKVDPEKLAAQMVADALGEEFE